MTKQRGQGKTPPYKWLGHIQIDFTDAEKKEVLDYVESRQWDLENSICVITQGGTSVKFTYDTSKDAYLMTLQPKERGTALFGYTIGYLHQDLQRLSQIAVYIVTVMIENGAIEIPDKSKAPSW